MERRWHTCIVQHSNLHGDNEWRDATVLTAQAPQTSRKKRGKTLRNSHKLYRQQSSVQFLWITLVLCKLSKSCKCIQNTAVCIIRKGQPWSIIKTVAKSLTFRRGFNELAHDAIVEILDRHPLDALIGVLLLLLLQSLLDENLLQLLVHLNQKSKSKRNMYKIDNNDTTTDLVYCKKYGENIPFSTTTVRGFASRFDI